LGIRENGRVAMCEQQRNQHRHREVENIL